MIKFELRNEYCDSPANSDYKILRHPSGDYNRSIELAFFNEHRFAFYYWLKWNQRKKNKIVPDLITFDWHQDLAYPCDEEKKELRKLNLEKMFEVSFFSWARLNPLNDNHILSAAYLDQINDIWVVCKQCRFSSDWNDEVIEDLNGKVHLIKKFPNRNSLFEKLKQSNISNLYFDIDLDYFTIENSTSNDKHKFTYMKKSEIESIFDNKSEFMQWIFKRMEGFTIAMEPEHTGGIISSLKYFSILNKLLFDMEIPHWNCEWKHLTNKIDSF